jgi:uncharacterized flavoprotein (TIGR03862 family)
MSMRRIAVIGAGPAGLMAAETARDAGAVVSVYDQMPSVARKFLIAGKGGLNLTHSEPFDDFVARYPGANSEIRAWLLRFPADALRAWAHDLGYETVIGSSGRVFPADFKAGPLLRAWIRRIRSKDIEIHTGHRWLGWGEDGALRFATKDGEIAVVADGVIMAMGGGSWPELGADGAWVSTLREASVEIADLRPSNCGFECDWSQHMVEHFAGKPVKSVSLRTAEQPRKSAIVGEFMLTQYGVEGSAIYALSARLRDTIASAGSAELLLDLVPDRSADAVKSALARDRGKRSLSEHLRRTLGIDGVKAALIYECVSKEVMADPLTFAHAIKRLPLKLLRTRPLAEAISSAGGVRFDQLTPELMLRRRPGVWCAGEMIDWEAPTGGYLLSACFASGRWAGLAAAGART